jgi:RND family efflux transporter MFP subunit
MHQPQYRLLFIAFLAMMSCKEQEKEKVVQNTDTIPVKTLELQSSPGQKNIELTGQFTTEDEVLLSFKTGGLVQRIYVKEGDAVRKGQLLASLQLTEISAQVQQAVIAYEKAQRDHQRAERLYKDSVATLEQYQNSKTGMEIAQQQLQAARYNLQHSEIRSASDGFVLRKMGSEGQLARPGEPIFLINGAQKGNWVLKASASDRDWALLQKGDAAIITSDALLGKELNGQLVRKSEGLDPATGTFSVLIQVNGKESKGLASGLIGKAKLKTQSTSNFWQLPYDALLDGDAEEAFVFITEDGKTAKKQKVRIASISHGIVWISEGLENAKEVIVQGNAYLEDGSKISKIEKKQ